MTPNKTDAIEAFKRLGFTTYEARVFIALQRLGPSTAKKVAEISDVPRSQVYSTAECLEERGLLEVQQSRPIRYRPVSVDEARTILRARFERNWEQTLEYVETVCRELNDEQKREDIWTVRGSDRINDRVIDVLSTAQNQVLFGVQYTELLTNGIEQALRDRAVNGVDITVISQNRVVRDRIQALQSVEIKSPPDHYVDDDHIGRIVISDEDSILISVISDDTETGIWSSDSAFASILSQIAESSLTILTE